MTTDQIMGMLRQILPIVGTMLTVFGMSSATANSIVNLIMTGAGPALALISIVWAFIANSRSSIMASAAKSAGPGIPAPQIVLPTQESSLAASLPSNVNTTNDVKVVSK